MYTMFILHTFYLFIYLMSADILVPLCLEVVVRSELFDKNTIMLAVRIRFHYGADQVAHSCADL